MPGQSKTIPEKLAFRDGYYGAEFDCYFLLVLFVRLGDELKPHRLSGDFGPVSGSQL